MPILNSDVGIDQLISQYLAKSSCFETFTDLLVKLPLSIFHCELNGVQKCTFFLERRVHRIFFDSCFAAL